MQVVISTFYKFVHLADYRDMRMPLLDFCQNQDARGSILLAEEGINATISASREAMDTILAYLRADERFADLETKESFADFQPFKRMKVRLKREIVHLGIPGIDPNKIVGIYVPPQQWNDIIQDPDVILIDTRNDYEYTIGTFQGAINPDITSFADFPHYIAEHLDPTKHKKVAMFCTGGIRCEKATAYALEQGFEEVYHLQGGILKYLEEIDPAASTWEGECFVFDDRVAVDHHLQPGQSSICPTCQEVLRPNETCATCVQEEDMA